MKNWTGPCDNQHDSVNALKQPEQMGSVQLNKCLKGSLKHFYCKRKATARSRNFISDQTVTYSKKQGTYTSDRSIGNIPATKETHISLVVRKAALWVSDQVRHKPGCTATEDD